MKKTVKFALTTMACVLLAACGSGGSDGGSAASTSSSATSGTSSSNANTGSTTGASTTSGTGAAYVFSHQDENAKFEKKVINDSKAVKQYITVDGQQITIGRPGIYSAGWENIQSNKVCCGAFANVSFGAIENGPDEKSYLFYNGVVSSSVPTSGSATYNGQFIVNGNNHAAFDEEDYVTGKAQFNVDFANKKLTGSMTAAELQPINVSATLSGTGFNGNATSSDFGSKAELEGKFYGAGASELGGMFKATDDSWGGAFGAKK